MELLEIAKLLETAENSAIHLNPLDNVAITRRYPSRRDRNCALMACPSRCSIPCFGEYYKIAIARIPAGEVVHRYGQVIGRAKQTIEPGRHVHTHNVSFEELSFEYEFPSGEIPYPALPKNIPTFRGYLREDGRRRSTRNYIAVVAASNCAAHTAELIAGSFDNERLPSNVDGVVAFPHGEGCGHTIGPDTEQLRRTLAGVLAHPNVSAAIILGLGCEVNQIDHYLGPNAPRSSRLVGMTLQSSGGTRGALEAARRESHQLMEQADAEQRVDIPASKIVLGLNCGGSDSFSGITANPALGVCCDMLAANGATAVLAETTECFGAEHLLIRRARNRQVAERFLGFITSYKQYLTRFGGNFNDGQLRLGIKKAGFSNILEKIAGGRSEGRQHTADGRGGLRRAHYFSRIRLYEHSGLRSGFAHRPGSRRM